MNSDKDLRKSFKVYVDEDGILRAVFLIPTDDDVVSTQRAGLVRDAVFDLLNKNPGKTFNVIADLTPLPKATISFQANLVYREIIHRPDGRVRFR